MRNFYLELEFQDQDMERHISMQPLKYITEEEALTKFTAVIESIPEITKDETEKSNYLLKIKL